MASRHEAVVVAALSLCAGPALAVPTTVTYAGVLEDSGVPVNATVDAEFTIFDDAVAGNVLYTEDDPGTVVLDGQLVVELGKNNLDDSVLDAPNLFLEVRVDTDVLAPRVRLSSVPYALRAAKAEQAAVADALGSLAEADVVTHSDLVTLHLDNGIAAGTGLTFSNGTISIANLGVTNAQLGVNSVALANMQTNSVDSTKIVNNTITDADIATTAFISGTKLATGTVGTAQLATDAITQAKIGGAINSLRSEPAGCGGHLTFGTTCATQMCGVVSGAARFFQCGGVCDQTSAQICNTSAAGFTFSTSFPP